MSSPIGDLHLVASARGLQGVFWKKQAVPMARSLRGDAPTIQALRQTVQQLDEYFEGKRKEFELDLYIVGTVFQRRVWLELMKIPYGKTCSYSQLAQKIQNPKAVRAVGSANGRNPLSIVIPCHRVIASNGTLGGYAGGLDIKNRLLELEKNSSKGR